MLAPEYAVACVIEEWKKELGDGNYETTLREAGRHFKIALVEAGRFSHFGIFKTVDSRGATVLALYLRELTNPIKKNKFITHQVGASLGELSVLLRKSDVMFNVYHDISGKPRSFEEKEPKPSPPNLEERWIGDVRNLYGDGALNWPVETLIFETLG